MNARWAMAAVTGIVTTEVLGIGGPWYEAGQGEYDLPIPALLAVQFPVMGILELKRMRGFLATGKSGVNESFPWDPMGMNNDAMALKEIKNGRLAMIRVRRYRRAGYRVPHRSRGRRQGSHRRPLRLQHGDQHHAHRLHLLSASKAWLRREGGSRRVEDGASGRIGEKARLATCVTVSNPKQLELATARS